MTHRTLHTRIIALLLIMAVGAACRQEDAEENQRKSIENYLGEDYQAVDGIYFKLLRPSVCGGCPAIAEGSSVNFAYTGRVFRGAVFVTSDTAQAAAAGIYPLPLWTASIGQSPLVEGVRRALRQMRAGDSAHVVFPFTLGYGESVYVGVVPPMSAQEWIIVVKNIGQ